MPDTAEQFEDVTKRLAGQVISRRTALKSVLGAVAAKAILDPWDALAQGQPRTVNPRSFGAKGDGRSKDTIALQTAIDHCASAGGGTILVDPGTYVCGTLVLKSNITFHLQAGATILGSPDQNDYVLPPETLLALRGAAPGRHLIHAVGADNLVLRGPGVIDGHSSVFLADSGRPTPKPEDLWKAVYSAETVRTTRISPMVELIHCNNLLVEDITLQNAAGWTLRPVACKTVKIQGVKIRNPLNASNADGIDPTSCDGVQITNCDIITGDDAICVKSNNPYDGNKVCRNVTVTNCRVSTSCNGLKVGSEGPSGFENIVFRDCVVYSDDVSLDRRVISGIAIEMPDGSYIDGVTVSNITMTNVRAPIFIRLQGLWQHEESPVQGRVENITISDVRATGAILTSSITGQPGLPVQQISLSNIDITTEEPGREEWASLSIPEKPHGYCEATMMGRLPAYGIYARHVKGLTLKNLSVRSKTSDPRPLLVCDDVQALTVEHVDGTPSGQNQPTLDLRNVQTAMIRNNTSPAAAGTYVRVSGDASHNVILVGNDLSRAKQKVQIAPEVRADAVKQMP